MTNDKEKSIGTDHEIDVELFNVTDKLCRNINGHIAHSEILPLLREVMT